MKKVYLLFGLIISLTCNAQDEPNGNEDTALFYKGIGFYEASYEAYHHKLKIHSKNKEVDSLKISRKFILESSAKLKEKILEQALEYFDELIENYPESKLYFMALNNKAEIEYELEYDAAKDTFIEILKSDASDNGPYNEDGLTGEAYANYKNRACLRLAYIAHESENYNEAIKYLKLTEKYPYYHFCGNAYAENDIYMAQLYAKNYIALGNNKKALDYLLPHVFPSGFADNEKLVKLTANTIEKEYGSENAKEMFATAKKTLRCKSKKGFPPYVITFLGREIEVAMPPNAYSHDLDEEMDKMVKVLENSLISQLLK
ncbi:tetratricopeptide repeat protein [Flavobacterium litorale]|uniref:Tetratricopeptide repeat protein n=1 Tax=Flavobacterium litorale TaxID=2856519 RepID=A0ABX8V9U5_9FLAO|nr:hypothetical protein [Flavobacterium litorale]QYJ67791.1 hypothetical protein K1I41_09595 [Flavobacterium litorale]